MPRAGWTAAAAEIAQAPAVCNRQMAWQRPQQRIQTDPETSIVQVFDVLPTSMAGIDMTASMALIAEDVAALQEAEEVGTC